MRRHSRRLFLRGGLTVTGLGSLAGCGIFRAQRPPRIGYLSTGPPGSRFGQLRDALAGLGYVDGRSVAFDHRFATPSEFNQLPDRAAELVRLDVDLIVVDALAPALAAKQAIA